MDQRELARWLKLLDVIALACCLGVLVTLVPARCGAIAAANPQLAAALPIGWTLVVLAAVPMVGVFALAWQIFGQISRDNSFSDANAARLKRIGQLASAEACLFAAVAILAALAGVMTDGLVAVMVVAVMVSGGLGVVGFALSHLTAKAAAIKAENDLTV